MEKFNLSEMKRGWFIGNFSPTLYKTNNIEVAVKYYNAGDHEAEHFHKIAKEITVVIMGKIKMKNMIYNEKDIVIIEPGESTDFTAITDAITTVVKIPGANNDKYLKE